MGPKYPINQRVREIMAELGFADNVDGFYKEYIGKGSSERLRTVYKDINLIKLDFLLEIAEKIGKKINKKLDYHWLMTGEGEMFLKEKHTAATNSTEAAVLIETIKKMSDTIAELTHGNAIANQTISDLMRREMVKQ